MPEEEHALLRIQLKTLQRDDTTPIHDLANFVRSNILQPQSVATNMQ